MNSQAKVILWCMLPRDVRTFIFLPTNYKRSENDVHHVPNPHPHACSIIELHLYLSPEGLYMEPILSKYWTLPPFSPTRNGTPQSGKSQRKSPKTNPSKEIAKPKGNFLKNAEEPHLTGSHRLDSRHVDLFRWRSVWMPRTWRSGGSASPCNIGCSRRPAESETAQGAARGVLRGSLGS